MKSIKLSLAVLMLAAAFTACTKEEFAPTQEIQKDEFVGAKLIGSELSVNFVKDSETKVDAYGDWEKGDEAGLGWIINGSVGAEQSNLDDPTSPNLYANHLFVKGDADFATYGNVYEGWHFGYYPYNYQPKMGVAMEVVLNPTQKDAYEIDQYKNRLHLSARQFLTAEDNLDGRTLVNTELKLRRAVKTIKVTVKPDASFKSSNALNGLAITKVQFDYSGDTKPFKVGDAEGKVALALDQLAAIQDNDVTEKYDEEETEKAFYEALSSVWGNAVDAKTIYTSVNNSAINLSDNQVVRIYTLPNDVTVDKTKLKLTVFVEAGKFELAYVDPTSEDYVADVDGKNNEYLEKLAKAYADKGYMNSFTEDNDMQVLGLEFKLTADMFSTDFANISSEKAWNKAVAMVDALELDEAEFTIVKNGRNYWSFQDVDGDGNLINLPANAELTVNGTAQSLILNAAGEWPNTEDFVVDMNVEINKDLTVEGVLNVTDGHVIRNGATIYAGKNATIGDKEDANKFMNCFENGYYVQASKTTRTSVKPGTVVVEYGAYVYPAADYKYSIAYAVESTTAADIVKLNKMISPKNDKGEANVNTLIVKTALDLNALAVEGIEGDDRYEDNGVAGSKLYPLVETKNGNKVVTNDIEIRLQGGSLVHNLAGANTKVKNVIAESGVNTLDDVIVIGDITVNAGATLNINNTVTTLPKTYFYTSNITNNGTLNTNNVSLNISGNIDNKGAMSVTNGDVWYTGTITQDGTQSGKVQPGQTNSFVVNTEAGIQEVISKAAKSTGKVTIKLADDLTFTKQLNINVAKEVVLDLNGKTINNTTNIWNDQKHEVSLIKISGGKKVTIKGNGTVDAKKDDCYGVFVTGTGSNLIIENGTFVGNLTAVQVADGATLNIKGGTFNLKQLYNNNDYRYLINVVDADYVAGTTVSISGGSFYKFNPANNLAEGEGTNFLYNGGVADDDDMKAISTKNGNWYVVSKISVE